MCGVGTGRCGHEEHSTYICQCVSIYSHQDITFSVRHWSEMSVNGATGMEKAMGLVAVL